MHEAFKPIVNPLEKLVNVSHAANNHNKTLVKNEVKDEIKDEMRDDIKNEIIGQMKHEIHDKPEDLGEASNSAVKMEYIV